MAPAFRDFEKRQGTVTENKHCVDRVIWDRPQRHQACRKTRLRKYSFGQDQKAKQELDKEG